MAVENSKPFKRLFAKTGLLKLFALGAVILAGYAWAADDGAGSSDRENGKKFAKFASGQQKVSLIELYTSEGCSSCPPADRWLTTLKEGEALWENIVPVSFHVSYWDRLGWPDRFAKREFDTRQRLLARRADAGVYTPGMFRDGAEFRTWRRNSVQSIDRAFTAASERSNAAGNLEIQEASNGQWLLSFQPAPTTNGPAEEAFIAVLGNNLVNDIARGENAGKQLTHDFVVLQLENAKLKPGAGNALTASFSLDTSITSQPAIAAWVVDSAGTPVQALGGKL